MININSFVDELNSIFEKTATPLQEFVPAELTDVRFAGAKLAMKMAMQKEAISGLGATAGRAGVNLAVGGASRARALASKAMPAATAKPVAAASAAPAAAARKVLPTSRPAVPKPLFGIDPQMAAVMGA